MKICAKCKNKYSDDLLACPNCGSNATRNNPFGFIDESVHVNPLKVVLMGVIKYIVIIIPLMIICYLFAYTLEKREVNVNNYYEQTLYEEIVEYNNIKDDLDKLYEQKDWIGLKEYIESSDQDVLYHWNHYDIYLFIDQYTTFKTLVNSSDITKDTIGEYGFEIADMIAILNDDHDMYTNTFDPQELAIVTSISEDIKQQLNKLGINETLVHSIYQSCHDGTYFDYMCVVERLGE